MRPISKEFLSGEIQGAKRDLTVVNAGGGIVVAGLARDMSDGIGLAREQIDSGRALKKLRGLPSNSGKGEATGSRVTDVPVFL